MRGTPGVEMQHGGTNPSRMLSQAHTQTHTLSLTSLCIASGDECVLIILNIPLLTAIMSEYYLCFPYEHI